MEPYLREPMGPQPIEPQPRELQSNDISLYKSLGIEFYEALLIHISKVIFQNFYKYNSYTKFHNSI